MHLPTLLTAVLAGASVSAYKVTLYKNTGFSGTSKSYTTAGSKSLSFNARSWKWSSPVGEGCCVRFCYNGKDVGYRCGSDSNTKSSSAIDKVVLGCGSATLKC
ncbi:hypothetical protein QBC43DRAFT_353719 [Cladorrhinum sp. PSN259]|nr:hypothetical protein QBC43DRAFT_353719 [Cladorrhinum sp. PSN259]